MRGDSLRDFYAKTLAVLGLGVLAAAGAVVDYWPVGGPWPAVSTVAGLQPAAATLVLDSSREVPLPPRASRPRPAPVVTDLGDQLPVTDAAPAVVLESPPVPESIVIIESDLPAWLLVETIDLEAPPAVDAAPEDSRRLFGDAVRRTRVSLAAARVFLSGAVNGVVGAFRKVSPFFATGAVAPVPF